MPVAVVNMIPNALSGETNRDSEPNLAVDPTDPTRMVASAFTPDPAASGSGPVFVSTDRGRTWALNVCLPGGNRTADVTVKFGGTSNALYAGILRFDNANLNILRKANAFAAGLMNVLVNRANDDQPWVEATTVLGGAGAGRDRAYISSNDFGGPSGRTASVDQSMDANAAAPVFNTVRLEPRATSGQDGPPVRTAIHPRGVVYGAYYGWRTNPTGFTFNTDIVVCRDDNWATGPTPYASLLDPGDGQAGVRVVTGTQVQFNLLLGTQRTGGALAIAVDPRDWRRVYLAYADGTTAGTLTLHLRRSDDGGATWTADLRTIVGATNPGLAVNVRGQAGFLYQRLTSPAGGNRWETHFERSSDGFASPPTDLILADAPDQNGGYTGNNPIGDYCNLVAAGKAFYGVFSANNTPNNANFPNGVTYQRNADFGTNTLLDAAGNPVAVSIDPFFFHYWEVAPEDDFYVRDWTESPTSGDTGVEPSTRPAFYVSSDVWNRRGTLPGTFVNDQPPNEDAGNGAGNVGDNWAFARVRRNAPAPSGATTVAAHFLVSKLGTGSNYVDGTSMDPDVTLPGADPTLTFAAADLGPQTTPAYYWRLDPVGGSHLCLAVEISTPADPFVPASLVGRAPGWPDTDLAVLLDNNKAQRNLGLSTSPARGVGMGDAWFYAVAHNAATYRRDLVLRYQTTREALKRLGSARIWTSDGKRVPLRLDGEVVLKNMGPGENRWVGLVYRPREAAAGEEHLVNFVEVVDGTPVNGFAVAARFAPASAAVRRNLELHRSVFTRLASLRRTPEAKKEAATPVKAGRGKLPSEKVYLERVRRSLRNAQACVEAVGDGDIFGLREAWSALSRAAQSGAAARVAVAHASLLQKLDARVTMLRLEAGDPADALQMVRWQRDLYRRSPALARLRAAGRVVAQSNQFVEAYGRREVGNKDYPPLLEGLVGDFLETARALRDGKLLRVGETLQRQVRRWPQAQKAHREFLARLDDAHGRAPAKA